MTSVIRHITFDVAAPYEPYDIARFWSQVLSAPVSPGDEPADDEASVEAEPALLFVRVPEDSSRETVTARRRRIPYAGNS